MMLTHPDADNAQLLLLCNRARQAQGIGPLQWSPSLRQVAQQHAEAMAVEGYFDHVDHQLRGVSERLNESGYIYRWAGENISAGLSDITAVFDWWMQSEGHRANILNPVYNEIGLGHYYVAPDRHQMHDYWVQVLATRLID